MMGLAKAKVIITRAWSKQIIVAERGLSRILEMNFVSVLYYQYSVVNFSKQQWGVMVILLLVLTFSTSNRGD